MPLLSLNDVATADHRLLGVLLRRLFDISGQHSSYFGAVVGQSRPLCYHVHCWQYREHLLYLFLIRSMGTSEEDVCTNEVRKLFRRDTYPILSCIDSCRR